MKQATGRDGWDETDIQGALDAAWRRRETKTAAPYRDGGSNIGLMVGTGGALWNTALTPVLADLARAVTAARQRPLPAETGPRQLPQRPGWAGKLVLEVLRKADAPVTVREVRLILEKQLGHPVSADTIRSALKTSHAARRGVIIRTADGRYVLRSS